jgi:hypothetical protein
MKTFSPWSQRDHIGSMSTIKCLLIGLVSPWSQRDYIGSMSTIKCLLIGLVSLPIFRP